MQKYGIQNIALALLGTTLLVPAANAQTADEQIMSVYERYRPDLSAAGLRTGSFLFYPTAAVEGKYDSNIFATKDTETDDYITIIKPNFALVSDWNNSSFSVFGSADIGRYANNGGEDYDDFSFGASSRIDISRGSNITADFGYSDKHEDRGSPDAIGGAAAPTKYSVLNGALGFKRDEGIVSFAVNGSYEKRDYKNVQRLGGGPSFKNNDRDREIKKGTVRFGYDLNEDYEAFVKFTAIDVKYDNSRQFGGPLRDSDGWDVVGGTAFNVGGKSEGEFYVGYVKRDYDSASLSDISEFKFGASVLWAASDLTSFRVGVDRNVTETTVTSRGGTPAAGVLSTIYSARLEHELRRNLLLNASASYNNQDYINIGRVDNLTNLGLGTKYLVNRTFSINADYSYAKRSTGAVVDLPYKRHAFIVSLSAQW